MDDLLKPIRVDGHVNVPPSSVITLKTVDRFDLCPGRPVIVNGRRYILTRREPAEFVEVGAEVFIVLGLDDRTKREKSHALQRMLKR